ncbi:prepilin-type N-terminal cleavage/methylation domain-containing protein [Bacillus sp. OV322]|uniref:PulJ/GspJ family protein n=1 Tax=Bacillus sp. OV322 TaxID=1882764 RepID=UPI0008F153BA|nr:prepilin-type N-terminal cleavage/methylation domain-containing protein [Bacillus sp. OV322]SFC54695.1 prepilin-type N-terminal cleavage/methylation domain-containing protein [Bacillus sp. OV322]
MKQHNEEGLTLIEVLVSTVIFLIISSMLYTVFLTTISQSKKVAVSHTLRNELSVVTQKMDLAMENIDSVTLVSQNTNGDFTLQLNDKDLGINDPKVLLEKKSDDLFINGMKINSDDTTLKETSFELTNNLRLHFILSNKVLSKGEKSIDIETIYRLAGDK